MYVLYHNWSMAPTTYKLYYHKMFTLVYIFRSGVGHGSWRDAILNIHRRSLSLHFVL